MHLLYTTGGEGAKNIGDLPTFVLREPENVKELVRKEGYDVIVICTDIWTMERLRQDGYRGRIVYEVQGLGTIESARSIVDGLSGQIRQYADGLLYPQTAHLKELFGNGFPDLPQFCFDDPLDTENFEYTPYPPKPFPIIGWVGRIEANKNWREFLEIGERLLAVEPSLYMWMFGDFTLYEPQEQAAFDHWLSVSPHASRLIRHSNIPHEQMADYMSIIGDSGGFLCSTSILEGFGYAVAEAMLCRCPVLSTDSDGIRRFLTNDVTGKLYERGNVEQAAGQAWELMKNKKLRESIRTKAQRHVRKEFSVAVYVRHFQEMLNALEGAPRK